MVRVETCKGVVNEGFDVKGAELAEAMAKRAHELVAGDKGTMDISMILKLKLLEVKRENFYKAYEAYMKEHDADISMMILRYNTPGSEEGAKDLEKLHKCWDELLLSALTVKEEDFVEASKRAYAFMNEKHEETIG